VCSAALVVSCRASLKAKQYAARGLQVTSEAFVGFGERTRQRRALMSMPKFRDSYECCIQCKATGNVRARSTHGSRLHLILQQAVLHRTQHGPFGAMWRYARSARTGHTAGLPPAVAVIALTQRSVWATTPARYAITSQPGLSASPLLGLLNTTGMSK